MPQCHQIKKQIKRTERITPPSPTVDKYREPVHLTPTSPILGRARRRRFVLPPDILEQLLSTAILQSPRTPVPASADWHCHLVVARRVLGRVCRREERRI